MTGRGFLLVLVTVILLVVAVVFCSSGMRLVGEAVSLLSTTPTPEAEAPQLGPLTLIGEPVVRLLPVTNEMIPNCSGSNQPVTMHPALVSTSTTSVEWEVGGQFGSGVQIGLPFVPVQIDLSAVLNVADRSQLQQSLQQGVTWDLSAAPGEIVTYVLSWEEIWQRAYVDVRFGEQVMRRVTVNYRTGIRSDIVSATRQLCEDGESAGPVTIDPVDSQITPLPGISTPGAAATPGLPTAMLQPSLPYVADWSQGFNGWAGSQSWKTVNGIIVNDGTEFGTIMSPLKPGREGVANYAVEAEIQVIKEGRDGSFGIIMRSDYYAGYIFSTGGGLLYVDHHSAVISVNECPTCYNSEILAENAFGLDNEWHTYRVEVFGNELRLLIDGREFVRVTDNRFLEGGEIGLWSYNTQLQVRNFRVDGI